MKILRIVIENLPHFERELDIDFVAQHRVDDKDREHLYCIFSNIYLKKALSFIGVNASGKTTILKATKLAMGLLANQAINHMQVREILKDMKKDDIVTITSYFYRKEQINKLETAIKNISTDAAENEKFIIISETLSQKSVKKVKSKKNLYEFAMHDVVQTRNQNEKYLMDDVSIMIAENKASDDNIDLWDTLVATDYNEINILWDFPKQLLAFLDPSIEYLNCDMGNDREVDIRLKFYGNQEIVINNPKLLGNYLSSGTIKGLSVFSCAEFALRRGSYFIVDELENHFNKELAATLIRFFLNEKTNPNGATLLFSTHYSELLDEFDRNDNIYIVRNKKGIYAENLSKALKRNDMKKSEVYDSDSLGGTAPDYETYIRLKNTLIRERTKEAVND